MRYEHIIAEVLRLPWAVEATMLSEIASILALRAAGSRLTEAEIEARVATARGDRAAVRDGLAPRQGGVAVMSIIGVLLPRGELINSSGAVSVQALMGTFRQVVADDNVAALVLDLDSPGGSVGGIAEFGDMIFEARSRKPIVACLNPMAASAGYWLAAQATELIATPSALVGSIGVYAAHKDISQALEKAGVAVTLVSAGRRKVLGNEFEPLSDEGRAEIQRRVDSYYDLFTKAVARGRGVSQQAVTDGYGEGGVVTASRALSLGMIDQIGTLEHAIVRAQQLAQGSTIPRAAARATAGQGGTVTTFRSSNANGTTATKTWTGSTAMTEPDGDGNCPEGFRREGDMCVPIDEARAESVDPNEDGSCPDGYEKGEDDRCHLKPADGAAKADIERRKRRLRMAGV